MGRKSFHLGCLLLASCLFACLAQEEPGPVQTLSFQSDEVKLEGVGSALQLGATVELPDGSKIPDVHGEFSPPDGHEPIPVEWTSQNEGVVAIDSSGMLIAKSPGYARVTARVGTKMAKIRAHVFSESENTAAPPLPGGQTQMPDASPPPPPEIKNVPPPAQAPPPGDKETDKTPPPDEGPPVDKEKKDPPPPPEVKEAPPPSKDAPFADRVVSFKNGKNGNITESGFPIVLGPPRGDVLSLGMGGEIVLEFTDFIIFDGPGPDFTVFENPFQVGPGPDDTFAEPGIVGVSNDGIHFVELDCNPAVKPYRGCAGVHVTKAYSGANQIDPTDPGVSGGDSFDLSGVGLKTARFVRIRDSGLISPLIHDPRVIPSGFDLDAIAIVHGKILQ